MAYREEKCKCGNTFVIDLNDNDWNQQECGVCINRLTESELKELNRLKEELFKGKKFVVLDHTRPEVRRYDTLMYKYQCFKGFVKEYEFKNR